MGYLKNQYLAWDLNIYAALDQRVRTTALKTLFMFCHVLSEILKCSFKVAQIEPKYLSTF